MPKLEFLFWVKYYVLCNYFFISSNNFSVIFHLKFKKYNVHEFSIKNFLILRGKCATGDLPRVQHKQFLTHFSNFDYCTTLTVGVKEIHHNILKQYCV